MKYKIIRTIAVVAIVGALVVPMSLSWGDVGGFSGSSGYSSSGGSSSSSGGGSYSGSSGSYYYYGGSGSSDDDGDVDGFAIMFGAVLGVIVIAFLLSALRKGGKSGSGQVQIQDTFDQSKVQPLASLKAKDPSFDADDVIEDVSNWYVRMQNAWTAGDFEPMRPIFSDALFAQFNRQLQQLNAAGQTNHVDNIAVLSVNVQGWYTEGEDDFLVAQVQTRIIDYTVDKKTGDVVAGSKDIEKFMTYRYILQRSSSVTTDATAVNEINCPNCGAVVDVNKSAKCPYCDSILTASTHGWVISAIQGLEQRNGS